MCGTLSEMIWNRSAKGFLTSASLGWRIWPYDRSHMIHCSNLVQCKHRRTSTLHNGQLRNPNEIRTPGQPLRTLSLMQCSWNIWPHSNFIHGAAVSCSTQQMLHKSSPLRTQMRAAKYELRCANMQLLKKRTTACHPPSRRRRR